MKMVNPRVTTLISCLYAMGISTALALTFLLLLFLNLLLWPLDQVKTLPLVQRLLQKIKT